PDADLMLVGEAPGSHEDQRGLPFVGAAGKLLTKLLETIGSTRDDVYVANVLKCRPPGNRDPLPEENDACKPWLKAQISLVDPLVICTLGNFATRLLLGTQVGITRLRGRRFDWRGRVLIPTFHPAAILRGGATQMSQTEDDFRLIAKVLEERRAAAPQSPDTEQLGLF
ncbi:MAG: uracil-DNA glycosylase, partial [Actinobacteria bacterium]|nr:uracil-DNA glycosylase [Actinomycetota bacterium]